MPPTRLDYQRRPFVRPAYEPDTRTLLQLMQMAGQSRANAEGRRGQARAEGLMTLGQLISGALASQRQGRERQQLAEMELGEKRYARDQDEAFRRDELALRRSEREAERTARRAVEDRVAAIDAVENTMPGPIDAATAATLRQFPGTRPLVSSQSELAARPTTTHIAGYAGTPDRRRALSGPEEAEFQQWYAPIANQMGLDPNPDSPEHQYDYRGAYRAGMTPDESTHWPSTFKQGGHPNRIVDGMDTRTMTPPQSEPTNFTGPQMGAPQRFDVRGMTSKEERQARIDAQAQADREADNARQLAAANKPDNPTEASLAMMAARGDQAAARALERLRSLRAPQPSENQPLMPVIGPDGKARYGTRAEAHGTLVPAGQNKPATGLEKRALNFFNRAQQADADLETMEAQIQQMGLAGQARMEYAPNVAQSQLGQSYLQAQRAFTEARLRKDSGAAIPEQEFANDRETYFAQPGDSPPTLEQKRRARAAILASLGFESGQALGEFLGDSDEATQMVQGYRQRAGRQYRPTVDQARPSGTLQPGQTVQIGGFTVSVRPPQ